MIRGTTPTLSFCLPFDVSLIKVASIVFSQNDEIKLEKTLDDCTIEDTTLTVKLSQDETLTLRDGIYTEIQIRVKMTSGDALASDIIKVQTGRILKDGVI